MKNVTAPMVKIEDKLMLVRNQYVLLDRDVAALYGVETRAVNQAVKNNPNKFPRDYIFQLDGVEFESLKSKILISNNPNGRGGVRKLPMAFTEKGVDIVMPNEATTETESSIELNFVVAKLKHSVRKIRKAKG